MKRDLERLANQTYDVLIVGGGIHGAVAAWDAALRGLSVALIERADFGSGTSQNSLKIIHGGLRYLQDANLSRIRTMARERTSWMRIAPHLVHPLKCVMPTRPKLSRSRLAMGAALLANDILSFDRNGLADPAKRLPGGKLISRWELCRLLPKYDFVPATGAAVWHDAQVYNTERLLLEFLISAVDAGADVANYVEAVDLITDGKRIYGVQAADVQTGDTFEVRSKVVINCAGAWIDGLLGSVRLRSEYSTSVAVNIIVDQVWSGVAAGLPTRPINGKSPQILFFVPWRDKTMIGTWHIPWQEAPGDFKLTETIVQEFLNEINSAHPPLELSLADIKHATWGFLPVNREDEDKDPVKLTRDGVVIDHQKRDGIAGLISVLGVKYTTARVVAERSIDLAVKNLSLKLKPCRTRTQRLKGGKIADFNFLLNQAVADVHELESKRIIEHLVYTYGSEFRRLTNCNLKRIEPGSLVTEAELIHAVREEMALTLLDVIQRRTELGAAGLPSMSTLQKCAELMGGELGWTIERREYEIDAVLQAYPFKSIERVST